MNDSEQPTKTKRAYRRITPAVVSRFKAEEALQGNGSAAIAILEPDIRNRGDKAYNIRKQADNVGVSEYMEDKLDQIAVDSVDRLHTIVNGTDDALALKASMFGIEQKRGKAIQRNQNTNINLNIQSVLE